MTENYGQAAPGWYPDPSGAPRQRYFDGEQWTENYHDAAAAAAPAAGAAPMGGAMAGGVARNAESPIDYYKRNFTTNFANFDGRARRAEYWYTALVNFGAIIAIAIVASILASISGALGGLGFAILGIYYLASLIPLLALSVRRMHDTGRSGWWILVPLAGPIIAGFIDGDRGPNQYGPSPKY